MGVSMLRGRRIPLVENEKVSKLLKFLGFFVSSCLGFMVTSFQRFEVPKFENFKDPSIQTTFNIFGRY